MKANMTVCIKVIRAIDAAGGKITSYALLANVDIRDTERSTASDIAAGWISTLRRYGFLRVAKGEKVKGPSRQLQVYQLTDWGRRYKVRKASDALRKVAANPRKGD